MQLQTSKTFNLCQACGINPTRSRKATRCESCAIALKRATAALAVYRHRVRAASGRAKHNRTYRGQPTKHVIAKAIEVLQQSGVLRGGGNK